jgi:chemotaxis protein MotA
MDVGSLTGVILGIGLILGSIMLQGALGPFISVSSILIVLGGTIAATLINFNLSQVIGSAKIVKIAFMQNKHEEPKEVIDNIVRFAEKARREGLLALEAEAETLDDDFMKKGVELIVDGTDAELVREILETELSFLEERHRTGASIFDGMGASAPAFGMIGTLIGLILMLGNLSDPSAIGPGMATALITTLYGSFLANLFFIPIAGKLKLRSADEILNKQLVIEGILSIQAGENPRIVAEKMKAFLSPSSRKSFEKNEEDE